VKIDPRLAIAWRMNRLYPVLLAVLLLLVLGLSLLISYRLSPELNRLERRYLELEASSRHAQQLKLAADTPAAIFRRGKADLARFLELVPEKTAFTDLIKEVFDISQQAGLDIAQVSYDNQVVKDQGLLESKLNFSVAGTYPQLKKFVYLLERSPRLIAIESLTLNSSAAEPGQIALRLELATFFRTEAP